MEARSGEARERLLDRVLEALAEHGVGDRSLRQIATAVGTSHRMLIYHFGSREALLVEVVRAVERRQREVLAGLTAAEGSRAELAREFWRRISDPALAPYERLFFELYGQALAGDSAAKPLLEGIIESWLEPIGELLSPDLAADDPVRRARARLAVVVGRGALLDLLATGDRAGVDRAVEEFAALLFAAEPAEPT